MNDHPISVLVVDDEPVLRELVAFILTDKGFHVLEAESGNAAYRMICKGYFDVVVSDVRMPDGSGVDLLKRISAMQNPKPQVFLVSGYSEISLEEARMLGARDLLNKPVDYDKLCQAIMCCARQQISG
jgi:two-component system response regulator PilR (NtrC family)